MKIIHEKDVLDKNFPFELWIADEIEYYPHWHEGIEIVYLLNGEAKVGLNDKVINLIPGDILWIGKGDSHYFLTDKSTGHMVIMQFDLSIIEKFSTNIGSHKVVDPLIHKKDSGEYYQELEKAISRIVNEDNQKKILYELEINAQLYRLIVTIFRHRETLRYSAVDRSKQLMQMERLDKVFDYVEAHFEEQISLDDVAKLSNYSPFHFTRFFKSVTGMTFVKFLNSYRVKKAETLLLKSHNSVTEVAQKSGFNSIKTFNRVFKEIKW